MSDDQPDPWASRRGLSFAQAEGLEPLPQQLALGTLSKELKAYIWSIFVDEIPKHSPSMGGYSYIADTLWNSILKNKFVLRDHKPADEYSNRYSVRMSELKSEVWSNDYLVVFGLLQWLLGRSVPNKFREGIAWALEKGRAAYRVVDGNLIVPLSSEADAATFQAAVDAAAKSGLDGARSHLREAGAAATAGRWADSVRESISAVESVALMLDEKSKTLGPALSTLTSKMDVHPALKGGFGQLYGFTSDESGIRHALLEKGDANVDETDALFMLSACAAFVSYLIGKGRAAGLLK